MIFEKAKTGTVLNNILISRIVDLFFMYSSSSSVNSSIFKSFIKSLDFQGFFYFQKFPFVSYLYNLEEIFSYIARDKNSSVVKGEIKAIQERMVLDQLKKMGLDPISITSSNGNN